MHDPATQREIPHSLSLWTEKKQCNLQRLIIAQLSYIEAQSF